MSNPVTLVVGASPNPERYAWKAASLLQQHNHAVRLLGQKKGESAGLPISDAWPEPGTIDTVTLYVGPANQETLIPKILTLHPRRIIFNPGTENPDFIRRAQEAGIETEIACTLVLLTTHQY